MAHELLDTVQAVLTTASPDSGSVHENAEKALAHFP